MAELAAEARKSGHELCDLTGSNPAASAALYPDELLQILLHAQSRSLAYRPEPFGLLVARQAVSRHLARAPGGAAAGPEDVMLTASTSEAYSFLFKLLCDPGDAVLVPAPSYPLLEHLAELESVQLVPYRLAYDGAWHIDFESLRPTASTRAIVAVSPNNPTGNYLAPRELHGLAQLGLPLLVDEVFHEYPLEAAAPPRCDSPDCLTFRLGGLSKLAGLPQLKLGWTIIAGPDAARVEARERLELIADTFLSVGTPVQQALPELLALAPQITANILARCRQNLATLRRAAEGSPLSVLRAEGGWSAVVQLPKVHSEDELVMGLLSARQVLVQPGWFYDFETDPYAVVSLLTDAAVFARGAERLVAHFTHAAG